MTGGGEFEREDGTVITTEYRDNSNIRIASSLTSTINTPAEDGYTLDLSEPGVWDGIGQGFPWLDELPDPIIQNQETGGYGINHTIRLAVNGDNTTITLPERPSIDEYIEIRDGLLETYDLDGTSIAGVVDLRMPDTVTVGLLGGGDHTVLLSDFSSIDTSHPIRDFDLHVWGVHDAGTGEEPATYTIQVPATVLAEHMEAGDNIAFRNGENDTMVLTINNRTVLTMGGDIDNFTLQFVDANGQVIGQNIPVSRENNDMLEEIAAEALTIGTNERAIEQSGISAEIPESMAAALSEAPQSAPAKDTSGMTMGAPS